MITECSNRFQLYKQKILTQRFARMNDMQRQAVFQAQGPVLILAGAGSGKTTVLVNRIANLVEFGNAYWEEDIPPYITEEDMDFLERVADGSQQDDSRLRELIACRPAKPWQILAITFTNKAAGELKERLFAMLGEDAADIQASTFHSACVRILRREIEHLGYERSFTIYDTDDSIRVIKEQLKAMRVDEKSFNPRSILSFISQAKDQMTAPEEMLRAAGGDYRNEVMAKVYDGYQKQLKAANALDFDDIITLTVRLFMEHPDVLEHYQNRYRYIMVDEYQDTNHAQYMLVSLLAQRHHNICVVGDDDQSIYKFRGATIENIMSFEKQFPGAKVIRLEQNYRCTQTILDAANAVIENNTERKGKTLWTDNGGGEKITVYRANDELEESKFVAETIMAGVNQGAKFSDNAILYRMNAQSNSIERAFVKSAIPYRIIGGVKFYERKEIKDIIAYLSVINNPRDTLRLKRIVNEPKRGIGDATLATCEEIAAQLDVGLFEVMAESDQYAPLSKKSRPLLEFARMMQELMAQVDEVSLVETLEELLEKTGYLTMLRHQGFEGQGRIENIEELKSNMVKYMEENEDATLSGFLEEIALYTDLDSYNTDADAVVMMTLHSAKGLEFPNVFIVGMEEGIFPGIQAIRHPAEVEEERRLAYVGITRAKKRLYLCNSAQRLIFGQTTRNRPSRFLKEIPEGLCDIQDQTLLARKLTGSNKVAPKRPQHAQNNIGVAAQHTGTTIALSPGDRVKHKVFGEGMILSVTPMGNDHLVEIAFQKVGTKKIMSNFAKLTKLS